MNEHILKDYETFEELPSNYLLINDKCNVFYLRKKDKFFIVREQLKKCILNKEKRTVEIEKNYLNVINGDLVASISKVYFLDNNEQSIELNNLNIYIESLKSILNLKDDEKYLLTYDDVKILTHFKEEKNKEYYKK